MEWIFDGIGTELVLFIIGIVTGAAGHKLYIACGSKNKQIQTAGAGSIQIQENIVPHTEEKGISAAIV